MKQLLNKGALGATMMAWALLACPLAAHADDSALAPSAALKCLTRLPGAPVAPEYPPTQFERKEGDTLQVELEFRGPDDAPKVTLDKELHYREFMTEIREFARFYRVPCMGDGASPVILRQTFVFTPTDGRKVMPPLLSDKSDDARNAQLKCIVHTEKMKRPTYPNSALRLEVEENLVARLRFTDPALAPEVVFLSEPKHQSLRSAIESYAAGLRMPCLANGPNEVDRVYRFTIQGGERTLLRDMDLLKLLSGGKDYPLPAIFDFNTMACPFDVRLTYFRPYMPNRVQEVENNNPARRPLLAWLSKVTINFDDETNKRVLGAAMNVTIPCGTLNLP